MSEGFFKMSPSFFKTEEPATPRQTQAQTAMYDKTTFGMPEQPKPAPSADEQIAARHYAKSEQAAPIDLGIPSEVAAQRAADGMNAPFSIETALMEPIVEMFTDRQREFPADMPEAEREKIVAQDRQVAREWSRVLGGDLALDHNDVTGFVNTAHKMVAAADDGTIVNVIHAQRAESLSSLKREFGDRWETALAGAKQMVARDYRIKAQLDKFALNDAPEVILPLARSAMRQINQGRLRIKR